jgi:uncharacterized delta-60 repeat protein
VPPTLTSFGADPATIAFGTSSNLTGVFSGGTGVITPGNLAAASGAAVSVSPIATTTYTLTVTSPQGAVTTAQATVTLTGVPASGSLDPTFGTLGDLPAAMVLQADGRVLVGGSSHVTGGALFALARYAADGSPDPSFGSSGEVTTAIGTTDAIQALALQADGRIVAAGSTSGGIVQQVALARYNTDGSLDTTFGTGGKVTTAINSADASATAVAIQPDGRILVAGNALPFFFLARYQANGSLDPAFGSVGIVTGQTVSFARALALQGDGRIIVAEGASTFALARYSATGVPDGTFGSGGFVTTPIGPSDDVISALCIQPNGQIVAAGMTTDTSGDTLFALARYGTDGSLDAGFGTSGIVTLAITGADAADGVAVRSDGRIVAAGATALDALTGIGLVRFEPDGKLDAGFGTRGIVTTGAGPDPIAPVAMALQADGRIVVAAQETTGGQDQFAVLCYLP